ncbi:hypothetical protein F5B21DRAFT_229081 [Xylaria acuta]|nr:hypothetical protein F5B21DRAFT_229081 [Xylaria acuta]
MVVRGFSLRCPSGSSSALLVNPYDVETADAFAYTDADDDTGGWLALHKRRHQRAFAPYLAAASASAAAAANRRPTPDDPLSRAQAEILRMALEFEAETSDENSVLAPTEPAAPPAAVGAEATGGVSGPPIITRGEWLPRASFLERCGKALARKRSFWKKKEEN